MRKLISYIAGFIVAIQAISPPFEFNIYFLNSPLWFCWTFLLCGFISFYLIFTKANIWVKILIPYLFLNCFLSVAPHYSQTSFIAVIECALFYLICKEIDDWDVVIKIVFTVLCLEIFMVFLQGMGKETLLNFGAAKECIGSVGNPMQFKSLLLLLFGFLIIAGNPFKKYLIPLSITLITGILVYAVFHRSFYYFYYARGEVWLQSFALSYNHPFFGYGLGTFKLLFPILGKGHFLAEGVWQNAHNFWIQELFEIGAIGMAVFAGYSIDLFRRCKGTMLVGIGLVALSLAAQFPAHQSITALLLALSCARLEKEKVNG